MQPIVLKTLNNETHTSVFTTNVTTTLERSDEIISLFIINVTTTHARSDEKPLLYQIQSHKFRRKVSFFT